MSGMIGLGQDYRTTALQGMQRYATLDEKMKAEQDLLNKQDEAATRATNMSYGGMSGAAAGAALGGYLTSWSGPGAVVGMAIGSLVGAIAGDLF